MPNVVQPQVDGPLKVEGEIEIVAADGSPLKKTAQAWFCRCGKSSSKPFCDGSHKKAGFSDPGAVLPAYKPKALEPGEPGHSLRLTLKTNGPVRCFGDLQVRDAAGNAMWSGTQAALCRCGQSANKPFCDGSHLDSEFEAA
ncbi:MAG TPA: CDGSH iron-sulfur domain-containing protein [Burkholderiales bacterium]|nr:CDGSH iron-sulfur domain-containing protein [Burkholderiales bacterium]